MTHRFFVPPDCIAGESVVVHGGQARQMRNVLRLSAGDRITVLDNTGLEYEVDLIDITTGTVSGQVVARRECRNEPRLEIVLYQALLKGDKFDLVVQKCTEMGITAFVPMVCERCVTRSVAGNRTRRWELIAREAAEQSRRGMVPQIHPAVSFHSACESLAGFSLLPWEEEVGMGIKAALVGAGHTGRINIFIGPEGGVTREEVELARSQGVVTVTLGKRILRAETAGFAAVVAALYERGELGGSGVS